MASSQDVAPGCAPMLTLDAEALQKCTRESEWRGLQATCDLVRSRISLVVFVLPQISAAMLSPSSD